MITQMNSDKPETFCDVWENARRNWYEKEMVVSVEDGSCFLFSELDTLVGATANYLCALGLEVGQKIIIQSDNHVEYLFVLWAALRCGFVVAPVDSSMGSDRIAKLVEDVAPNCIFCDTKSSLASLKTDIPTVIFDSNSPEQPADGLTWFSEVIQTHLQKPFPVIDSPHPEMAAVILFTSGSSGIPKGVILSQRAICKSGALMVECYDWSQEDTLFSLGPLHTMSGFRNPIVSALISGATLVMAGGAWRNFSLSAIKVCQDFAVTILTTVPGLIHSLLDNLSRWNAQTLETVRQVLVTGSGINQQIVDRFCKYAHTPLYTYYGLTETGGLCCMVPTNCSRQGSGCLGIAVGSQIHIAKQSGELFVKSDQLMDGYLNNRSQSQKVLHNGWLATGDLVEKKDDGMLYLIGRKAKLLKTRNGELLHLEELSRCFERHPKINQAIVLNNEKFVDSVDFISELLIYLVPSVTVFQKEQLQYELSCWIREQFSSTLPPMQLFLCQEFPLTNSGKFDINQILKETNVKELSS